MPDESTVSVPLLAANGSIRGYTLIDATDLETVIQHTWRLHAHGYAYRRISIDRQRIVLLLHRELLGLTKWSVGERGLEVDHINRNRLDNRRSNLRAVPHIGNMQNLPSRKDAASTLRGVHFDRRYGGRWRANIRVNGRRVNLGSFDTEEEAGAVALAARLRLMPYAVD